MDREADSRPDGNKIHKEEIIEHSRHLTSEIEGELMIDDKIVEDLTAD